MKTGKELLEILGIKNQKIINTGSGSDWDLEGILDRLNEIRKPSTFKEAAEVMMKYLAENHHPHTMAQIEANLSILWEGKENYHNDSFLVD